MTVGLLRAVVGWRRWRARRRAGSLVARMRSELSPTLDKGVVTLIGTLRGGSATTLHFHGVPWWDGSSPAAQSAHTGARAPEIECGGERIALEGPVDVAVGTRTATAWRRPPAGTPVALVDAPRELAKRPRRRLTSVEPGDQVVVTGRLALRASGGEAAYRESGGRWVLRGLGAVDAARVQCSPSRG